MPRLLHASGRYDRPPSTLRRDLTRWRGMSDIVTLTEVGAPGRKAALHRSGWTLTSGKGEARGESAIVHNRAKWQRRRKYVAPITKGGGIGRLKAPVYAVTAVLQRRNTGKLLIVTTAHLPAHVETMLRLGVKAQPANAWRQAVKAWAAHIADVRAEFPDAELWIVADWNVDAGRQFARDLVRKEFHDAGLNVRIARTPQGTHGKRTIDFALTSLGPDPKQRAVAIDADASDHKAARFAMTWPQHRRKR